MGSWVILVISSPCAKCLQPNFFFLDAAVNWDDKTWTQTGFWTGLITRFAVMGIGQPKWMLGIAKTTCTYTKNYKK